MFVCLFVCCFFDVLINIFDRYLCPLSIKFYLYILSHAFKSHLKRVQLREELECKNSFSLASLFTFEKSCRKHPSISIHKKGVLFNNLWCSGTPQTALISLDVIPQTSKYLLTGSVDNAFNFLVQSLKRWQRSDWKR